MFGILFYKCFYQILHRLYYFFECIYDFYKFIIAKVYHDHEVDTGYHQDHVYLKFPRKTPYHLTILLGKEHPSYEDLANFVMWCLHLQIPFISFYDVKGILNKNEVELEYEVDKRIQRNDHIVWHSKSADGHKNGITGRKVHIKILSQEDSRQSVVNLSKNLSSNKCTDFSVSNIAKKLHKQFEFPEPDFGLYCGRTFNLNSYPPWQIRLTEFLCIKSHHNVTFHKFLEKMLRFSKCDKRFGK